MKTPLGKAQDTFVAIEGITNTSFETFNWNNKLFNLKKKGAIKLYFQQSQLQQTEPKQTNNISFDLTQVTLAVHFIEYLEELIYNA